MQLKHDYLPEQLQKVEWKALFLKEKKKKKRANIIQSDFLNKLINQVLSVEHFTLNYTPKARTRAKENHFLGP